VVVSIMRSLWRRRRIVAVGVVVGLLVAVATAYRVRIGVPPELERRHTSVGMASAKVLVDSQRSQVVDLGGAQDQPDVVALIVRARLLANLIATSPLRERIARRAGIDARTFTAVAPSLGVDGPGGGAFAASVKNTRAKLMTVYFDESLPIITIDGRAPDAATAARISTAAVTEMTSYLAASAERDQVPASRRLVVDPLGPARSATATVAPRRLAALLVGVLAFAAWCGAALGVRRLVRRRRTAAVG
jgi:hypothetical protein